MSDAATPRQRDGAPEPSRAGALARLRAEADGVTESIEETRTQFRAAVDARRGGPVTSPKEAATTMARLRASLEEDLKDLRAQVAGSTAPRNAGIAATGVAGLGAAVGILGRLRSRRSERRAHEAAVEEQATALALAMERREADRRKADPAADDERDAAARWPAVVAGLAASALGAVAAVRRRRGPATPAVDEP